VTLDLSCEGSLPEGIVQDEKVTLAPGLLERLRQGIGPVYLSAKFCNPHYILELQRTLEAGGVRTVLEY